jgi:hypothetical protein
VGTPFGKPHLALDVEAYLDENESVSPARFSIRGELEDGTPLLGALGVPTHIYIWI